jgi:hypothetical protein
LSCCDYVATAAVGFDADHVCDGKPPNQASIDPNRSIPLSSLPGLTRQSIVLKSSGLVFDGCAGQARA